MVLARMDVARMDVARMDVARMDVAGMDVAGRNGESGLHLLCLWIGCRAGGCVRAGILMRARG